MKYVIEMEFDIDSWDESKRSDIIDDLTYDMRSSRYLSKWKIVEKADG